MTEKMRLEQFMDEMIAQGINVGIAGADAALKKAEAADEANRTNQTSQDLEKAGATLAGWENTAKLWKDMRAGSGVESIPGTDAKNRPSFVNLQVCIDAAVAEAAKAGLVKQGSYTIHTPLPATPCRTQPLHHAQGQPIVYINAIILPATPSQPLHRTEKMPIYPPSSIENDPARFAAVLAQPGLVRDMLHAGIVVTSIYSKEALEAALADGTVTQASMDIFNQLLKEYPDNFRALPVPVPVKDQNSGASWHLIGNNKEEWQARIQAYQAVQKPSNNLQEPKSWGLGAGNPVTKPAVRKWVEQIEGFFQDTQVRFHSRLPLSLSEASIQKAMGIKPIVPAPAAKPFEPSSLLKEMGIEPIVPAPAAKVPAPAPSRGGQTPQEGGPPATPALSS